MTGIASLLRLIASALVPGGGYFTDVFSPSTVLALYWVDNLVGAACMTVRIVAHRRHTRARGHSRSQLGATYRVGDARRTPERKFTSFLAEFTAVSASFVIGHGLFLALLLYGVVNEPPDAHRLRQGATAILVLQLIGLAVDLTHIGAWPFARLEHQAVGVVSRILLVHVAIIGGMVFFAMRGTPWAFFSVFVWLKTLADIGSRLPEMDRDAPPRWLSWMMSFVPKQKGESFEAHWKRTRAAEIAEEAADELPEDRGPGGPHR